jgi:pyrroline-5-carboxylate reductase
MRSANTNGAPHSAFKMSFAVIGPGAMGKAIAIGLLQTKTYAPSEVVFYAPNVAKVRESSRDLGVCVASSPIEAIETAEVILLAVKPAMIAQALAPIRDRISPSQLIVSVAAGVSLAKLESYVDGDIPIVRAMPNTPSTVGAGATAFCGGTFATREHLDKAKEIFGAIGLAVEVEEKAIDAVTGLSGSGPAYVFLFIEALADGGVRAGLPRPLALQLATQTVLGGAKMVLETGQHPGVLKDQVASPGGTTITGIHALENGGFRGVVMDAVVAAANRSREMS